MHLHAGTPARCVVRLSAGEGTRVRVLANGHSAGLLDAASEGDWMERSFDVPAGAAAERTAVELRATGGDIETFHYWCAAAGPSLRGPKEG